MPEVLTISEIRERFDSEWLLIKDPQTDDMLKVLSGDVIAHSPNRDEVYREANKLKKGGRFAILYTGRVPDDVAIIL